MDPLGILIGRHEPLYQTAQQLAKVLNIPIAYLYCGGDNLAENSLTNYFSLL
jgi:transcriptional regulator with XRE-family HTH domain